MKILVEIHWKLIRKVRHEKAFNFLLFLFVLIMPIKGLWALDAGASVYVKEGRNEGDWTPAEYVAARSDCLILERLKPFPWKTQFLRVPSQLKEEKPQVGEEVTEIRRLEELPNSKMRPIVDLVIAVKQNCHEVKHAGGPFRLYILPGNVLKATEFLELRGTVKQFSLGDKVYAKEFWLTPEHWSLRKVVAKRDDCFETDSEKVLCGHYGEDKYLGDSAGQLFAIPSKITKIIKTGDILDGFSLKVENSSEIAAYTTLEGVVKTKSKETLTLESYNDDCAYDPVRIADIREAPLPLSVKDFIALKIGDVVLERVDPGCCCCSPYYPARKIVSRKRSCYLLEKEKNDSSTEARIPSQLIPADALDKLVAN